MNSVPRLIVTLIVPSPGAPPRVDIVANAPDVSMHEVARAIVTAGAAILDRQAPDTIVEAADVVRARQTRADVAARSPATGIWKHSSQPDSVWLGATAAAALCPEAHGWEKIDVPSDVVRPCEVALAEALKAPGSEALRRLRAAAGQA
jgi:hypothetical protein